MRSLSGQEIELLTEHTGVYTDSFSSIQRHKTLVSELNRFDELPAYKTPYQIVQYKTRTLQALQGGKILVDFVERCREHYNISPYFRPAHDFFVNWIGPHGCTKIIYYNESAINNAPGTLSVAHEIAHACNTKAFKKLDEIEKERAAWYEAIDIAAKMYQAYGLNAYSAFKSKAAIQHFMNVNL
ncbi:hypothetical protein KA478_02935 [Patescibacteria group bacterium]|nr:hypothetical protein [Patescibacteria group bacterium]